ncbi:hypothetical protein TNCV_697851 [Trichonephila clavipes]|nr:hypothetical protein TNCV_697851 [Trichonephila clavipes]
MKAQKVCDVRRITIRRDGQGAEHKAPHPDLSTPDLHWTVKINTHTMPFDRTSQIRCVFTFSYQRYGHSKNVSGPAYLPSLRNSYDSADY